MSHTIKMIKVIKPGILIRSETGVILDARSTVTFIQSESNNIIVDSSLKKDRKILPQALAELNVSLADINIVINTHSHNDHTQNNILFSSARIYVHYLGRSFPNSMKIESFPFKLEENIELIETPGHSWDSISVVVKADKTYVITGDAIPIKGNYDNWIPPVVHVDARRALDSMKKIVEIADIIIPGHDVPFEIKKTQN